MHESTDRAKAYSFGLQPDQAGGYVHIGWNKFKVSVTEYSWSGYKLNVDRSVARHLKTGRRGTLEYQGSRYPIRCLHSRNRSGKVVEVTLELREDQEKRPTVNRKKRAVAGKSFRLNERDPILSIATGIGILTVLLILPGWGEGWGTSNYLTEGFRSIVLNTCEACKSMLGR